MCLIVLGWQVDPAYPLVVAANRDEYFSRPTAPLAWWDDSPEVLAGRDLQAGGTWLGITRNGRFAAITNYRDPARVNPNAPSRGQLVADFLRGTERPGDYLRRIEPDAQACNGFNLLVADARELWWHSNVSGQTRQLAPGIHAVSNHLLDTPWPKLVTAKAAFHNAMPVPTQLFALLQDDRQHPDEVLPSTGVSLARERELSAIFVKTPGYGTRSSAVIRFAANNNNGSKLDFAEQTWAEGGLPDGPLRQFTLD
ncbi:MAG: NRDE family protein [Rhodocyclaceae bacterium]|nr:NRDE family protein [Rhodocyclaceae bacterium]